MKDKLHNVVRRDVQRRVREAPPCERMALVFVDGTSRSSRTQ